MLSRISILLYFFFLLGFLIFTFLFIDQNLIYLRFFYSGFAFVYRSQTVILYLFFVAVSFFLYFKILQIISKKDSFHKIIPLVLLSMIILLWTYPALLSYDIFNYIATSRVTYFYLENPYIVMPNEFIGDPLLGFTHASNKVALYGPVWVALSTAPSLFGFGNFLVTLLNFKFLTALFYLGTVILLWRMTFDVYRVILFALNPLVIAETLVSSHNDIVMVFFILLAFYNLAKKKVLLAIFLMIVSVLIKYATLVLIPVFLYIIIFMVQGKKINWNKIYSLSAILMFIVFIFSFLREEIYPWYAIWFLGFIPLLPRNTFINYLVAYLSLGLLLRYIPFMWTGTHFGITPFLKIFLSFFPPVIFLLVYKLYSLAKVRK